VHLIEQLLNARASVLPIVITKLDFGSYAKPKGLRNCFANAAFGALERRGSSRATLRQRVALERRDESKLDFGVAKIAAHPRTCYHEALESRIGEFAGAECSDFLF